MSRVQTAILAGSLGIVAAVIVVVLVVGHDDPKAACTWEDYRLPQWVYPTGYQITWSPSMQAGGPLSGVVTMQATVANAHTGCIIMHKDGLTLSDVTVVVKGVDGAQDTTITVAASEIVEYPDNQQFALPLGRRLDIDTEVEVTMPFSGSMSETLNGMYISQAPGSDPVVITQFEATYARKAFPCLDEPQFKAAFTVTLKGVQAGLTALSNMPVSTETNQGDGTRTVVFEESVPMSTYLVAVAIGQFDAVWATYQSPLDANTQVNVSIWAPPGNADKLDFALQCALRSLSAYESTFQIAFPLPEMKMLGAEDFAAGAMENWGLVTYRLTALLADLTSEASKERVAVVVAHELSHQWTGNLVTTAWWGQLFLNEGFATLLEYLGTNASHPEFGVWEEFLGNDVHRAMRVDDLANVDPLVNRGVDSSGAIESQFNDISYAKGGSVLRMLWKFMDASPLTQDTDLGPDEPSSGSVFFDAVHQYLSYYAYSVATASGLITQLANFTNYPELEDRAATWTDQPGVPLVIFAWDGEDNTDPAVTSGTLCVSQKRLFRSPYSEGLAAEGDYGDDQLYWVPLTMAVETPAGAPAQALAEAAVREGGFDNETYACVQHDVAVNGYVKANLNSYGYYRVAYPASVWERLKLAAEASARGASTALGPQDRAGLLDDLLTVAETAADAPEPAGDDDGSERQLRGEGGRSSLSLRASSGATSIATAFDYMLTLQPERDYTVWRSGLTHIARVANALVPEEPPSADELQQQQQQPLKATADSACRDSFLAFARDLLKPAVDEIGNSTWGGVTPLQRRVLETGEALTDAAASDVAVRNSALIGMAASVGNTAVVNRAVALWQGGLDGIDANYLSVVASTYVRQGGMTEWEAVQQAYEASTVPYSKNLLLRALAASQDAAVLNRTLYYAMNSEEVGQQDKTTLLAGVANNAFGKSLAWNFLTQPAVWDQLVEWYGSGGFGWSSLITAMGSNFASQEWFDVVQDYFDSVELDAGADEAAQALEVIQSHIVLNATLVEDGCPWLAANGF